MLTVQTILKTNLIIDKMKIVISRDARDDFLAQEQESWRRSRLHLEVTPLDWEIDLASIIFFCIVFLVQPTNNQQTNQLTN